MSVDWSTMLATWGAAFALYLVLEGILPFLNPQALKRTLIALAQLEDRQLRVFGLVSMIAGLALLYLVHS
jgi:uncharacterized protein YjeT (DUF2065 family)